MGQEGFEQEDGGQLIDDVFAVDGLAMAAAGGAGVVAGGVEQGVGVEGGEALVEQVVLECGVGWLQGGGKGSGFGGLRAQGAGGVERVAYDESGDGVLADEAGYGLEVGAVGGAVDREERLGGEVELIGDREADAAVTDIERERAGHGGSVRAAGRVRLQ